jgi:hypothetical protein
MLEQIQKYFAENTTTVIIAVALLISVIALFMYFRNRGTSTTNPNLPTHDFDGMESMNTVCDMASGVCHPQDHMEQMQQMQQQMQQELVAEGFGTENVQENPEQTTTM